MAVSLRIVSHKEILSARIAGHCVPHLRHPSPTSVSTRPNPRATSNFATVSQQSNKTDYITLPVANQQSQVQPLKEFRIGKHSL